MSSNSAAPQRGRKIGAWASLVLAALFIAVGTANAQGIPALVELSSQVATADPSLAGERVQLSAERQALRVKTKRHNAACGAVEEGSPQEAPCRQALTELNGEIEAHIGRSDDFNKRAVIKDAIVLSRTLRWEKQKRDRLAEALKHLDLPDDFTPAPGDAARIWRDVVARPESPELVAEAGRARGAELWSAGAGQQTVHGDCAIFALANAAGVPYSVVAARAGELIRQAPWRSSAERAKPQATMEAGLTGAEVLMLTESLGQVQVVPPSRFAETLRQSRPVMVNVFPGHEVVLSKSFQHSGETWYEVIDSYQGPLRRLYISHRELTTLLNENGIVYQSAPRAGIKLLR